MVNPKRLFDPAQLTAAAATYYSAPTNQKAVLGRITACNTTATARTVTAHVIKSGGAAAASNKVLDAITIPPTGTGYNTRVLHELAGLVLEAGDFLQMLSDGATAVTVEGAGQEIV